MRISHLLGCVVAAADALAPDVVRFDVVVGLVLAVAAVAAAAVAAAAANEYATEYAVAAAA